MAERNSGGGTRVTPGVAARYTTYNAIWPVGSLYMSLDPTSPATVLGFGTWEQLAPNLYLTSK